MVSFRDPYQHLLRVLSASVESGRRIDNAIIGASGTQDRLESLLARQLSRHFSKDILITPRARHALMCEPERDGQAMSNSSKFTRFGEDQILERLVAVSPALATPLKRADIAIEDLRFWPTYRSPGYPQRGMWERMFPPGGDLWGVVSEMRYLNEDILFRSIVEETIRKPTSWSRHTLYGAWKTSHADKTDEPVRREAATWPARFAKALTNSLAYLDPRNLEAGPDLDVFELLLEIDDRDHLQLTAFGTAGSIRVGQGAVHEVESLVSIPGIRSSPILDRDVLDQYQELLNSEVASEKIFQQFFEEHPMLLACLGDYSQVHAQVVLSGGEEGYKPDFMLVPRSSSYADLIELKRPSFRLATDTHGRRVRLNAQVRQGIAQLLEYRRFFNSRENRLEFAKRYGMRGCRPKMTLIIGRDYSLTPYNLEHLGEELPQDFELLTYDAVAARAETYIRMVNHFDTRNE